MQSKRPRSAKVPPVSASPREAMASPNAHAAGGSVAAAPPSRSVSSSRTGVKQAMYVVIISLSVLIGLGAVLAVVAPTAWQTHVSEPLQRRIFEARMGLPTERAPDDGTQWTDALEDAAPPPLRGASVAPVTPSASSHLHPAHHSTNATGLRCYTLEEYSDAFLSAPARRSRRRHYFQCGVRVTDLRTEHRPDHRRVCDAATAEGTAYPDLRIVLTEKEVGWHSQWQRNAAAERISLDRFGDDYCDCMDGTDELLTNACSMVTGSGMPLVGSRWKSYLVANSDVQLYEDVPPLKEDVARRTAQTYRRQGPVLPVRCEEDPTVLLPPSMVADGIVDCSDGSDESERAWASPTLGYKARDPDEPDADVRRRAQVYTQRQEQRRANARAVQAAWRIRRDALEPQRTHQWVAPSTAYVSLLNPQYVNVRALLVDTGYLSLFTTEEVLAARVALQEVLHTVFTKGHALFKTRVARGWDSMGKVITDRRTEVVVTLNNITQRFNTLRQFVYNEVQKRGVQTPAEANVDVQILQELDQLEAAKGEVENDLTYHDIILQQRLFGDYFEYYPLYSKVLSLPYADVIDPYRKSHIGHRARVKTGMTVMEALVAQRTEMHRLAMEGHDLSTAASAATSVLHVDNITVDLVGIHYGRHLVWRQFLSLEKEGEAVARASGMIPPDAPYDPSVFAAAAAESPFRRSPTLVTGHWMPYSVLRSATILSVTDPAGDAGLPRRLMVKPETPLLRGGGTLQRPYREVEKDRFLTIKKTDDTADNAAARLRKQQQAGTTAEEDEKNAVKIPLFYHQNTPNRVAAHVFYGGTLRCEPSLPEAYQRAPSSSGDDAIAQATTQGGVVVACDTRDRILSWAMDGRCMQEVVVGTPSACASWVVQASQQKLTEYKAQLAQWRAQHTPVS